MKKLFILFAYYLLSTACCLSQTWQWAKHCGSPSYDRGFLCIDSAGNSYITGELSSPSGIFGSDTISVIGIIDDAFITKVDINGNFIWSKRAGGNDVTTSSGDRGSDILFDKSSNSIIFCGNFDSNSPNIGTCNTGSGAQTFLSKLDTAGNCIWAQYVASRIGAGKIIMDNDKNIYMIGSILQAAWFNTTPTLQVQAGGFLAKFNSLNGNCIWAKKITESNSLGTGISFYNNKLYIVGISANDTLKLDTATAYCYPNNVFISEFDTAGSVQWVKTMGGPQGANAGSISLDGSGNIYATGVFKDTAYFGSTMLTNGSNYDLFLAKYNNTGTFTWVKQAHATGNFINGASVSSDANGNVYVGGGFSGTATFGTYTVTAATATDLFVARYDNNGNCIGVTQADNSKNGWTNVVSDNTGGFHVAGEFTGTTTFGSYPLTSYGGVCDVFVARHDAITGIQEFGRTANNQLMIYANPTIGKCNITVPDEFLHEKNLVLSIYDNTGRLIQQTKVEMNEDKIKLNLEAEAKGVYHATLSNGKKSYGGKIVFE